MSFDVEFRKFLPRNSFHQAVEVPSPVFVVFGYQKILHVFVRVFSSVSDVLRKSLSPFAQIRPVVFFFVQRERRKKFPIVAQRQFDNARSAP
jgi:hypothetical protein